MNDRLEQYLRNEMTTDARLAFEQELSANPELLNETKKMAGIMASLDHLKAKQLLNTFSNTKSSTLWGFNTWRYAAAIAGIILVGSLFILNSGNSSVELFDKYYKVYPNVVSPSERSGSTVDQDQVWQLYESGQYEQALPLFTEQLARNPTEQIRFYAGLTALEAGDTDLAQELLSTDFNQFANQAQWYLALTFIKTGSNSEASEVLLQIAESNTSYSNRASELLDLL